MERDDAAFRATADGACDVERRAGGGASRQNEAAKRRQFFLEPIDQLFEPDDMGVVDHRFGDARGQPVGRIGELGSEGEQIALEREELLVQRGIER